VECNRSFEVFQLFAESVRESAQPAAMHPQSVILFLNVARGDQINDGASCNGRALHVHYIGRGIPTLLREFGVAKGLEN
jgi:hypothetical protein